MPPPNNAALAATPHQAPGIAVGFGTVHRAEHHIYTTAEGTIDLNVAVHPLGVTMRQLLGTLAVPPGGDAIYLKFFNNEISSVRLPVPAPVNLQFFFTDNLSGCKFYVDTIPGSNDLIVYHANTTAHGPGLGAAANAQTAAADGLLDTLHTNAQADYVGLGLVGAASLAKPAYFLAANVRQNAVQAAKPASRYSDVSFVGGCTIVGFPQGVAGWDFYYQTWGDIAYSRSAPVKALFTGRWNYLHKYRTEGPDYDPSYATMQVLDYQQFH